MKRPTFLNKLNGQNLEAVEHALLYGFFESFGDRKGANYRGISCSPVRGSSDFVSYYNIEVKTSPSKLNAIVEQLNKWGEQLKQSRSERQAGEYYNPQHTR
jgi:hypothetical protein